MARILIIDDDSEVRAMLRAMLEDAGYTEIEEAANFMRGMGWREIDKLCKERGF